MNIQQFQRGMEYFKCPIDMALPKDPIRLIYHPVIAERLQIYSLTNINISLSENDLCPLTNHPLGSQPVVFDCSRAMNYFMLTAWQTFNEQSELLDDTNKSYFKDVYTYLSDANFKLDVTSVTSVLESFRSYYHDCSIVHMLALDLDMSKLLESFGLDTNYAAALESRISLLDARLIAVKNINSYTEFELNWLTSNLMLYASHVAQSGVGRLVQSFLQLINNKDESAKLSLRAEEISLAIQAPSTVIENKDESIKFIRYANGITFRQSDDNISACAKAYLDSNIATTQSLYAGMLVYFIERKATMNPTLLARLVTHCTKQTRKFKPVHGLTRVALATLSLNCNNQYHAYSLAPYDSQDAAAINQNLIENQTAAISLSELNSYMDKYLNKPIEESHDLIMQISSYDITQGFMSNYEFWSHNFLSKEKSVHSVYKEWLKQQLDHKILNRSQSPYLSFFPKKIVWTIERKPFCTWSIDERSFMEREAYYMLSLEIESLHKRELKGLSAVLVETLYEMQNLQNSDEVAEKLTQKIAKQFFVNLDRYYSHEEISQALDVPRLVEALRSDLEIQRTTGLRNYFDTFKQFVFKLIDFVANTHFSKQAQDRRLVLSNLNTLFTFPKSRVNGFAEIETEEVKAAVKKIAQYKKKG